MQGDGVLAQLADQRLSDGAWENSSRHQRPSLSPRSDRPAAGLMGEFVQMGVVDIAQLVVEENARSRFQIGGAQGLDVGRGPDRLDALAT